MQCAFCSILSDPRLHDQIVWSSDSHVGLLDIAPIEQGHLLVIPRQHIDYLFDMDTAGYLALMRATKEVAQKLKEATGRNRIVLAVGGFHVPHVHMHLIPTDRSIDVLVRGTPEPDESFHRTAEKLRASFLTTES